MAKATHNGICQCCGSFQKLPNGALSLHGYTTEHGFFNGTCAGSKQLPFEESKDLIEQFINDAKTAITELTAKADKIEATDSGLAWRRSYRTQRECDYGQLSGYFWEQAEIIAEEKENWTSYYWADLHGSDSIRKQRQADAGNSIHDETLEDIYKKHNTAYALQFRKQIQSAIQYIDWQNERIIDWKPQALKAI
jgi:hypothetical protein